MFFTKLSLDVLMQNNAFTAIQCREYVQRYLAKYLCTSTKSATELQHCLGRTTWEGYVPKQDQKANDASSSNESDLAIIYHLFLFIMDVGEAASRTSVTPCYVIQYHISLYIFILSYSISFTFYHFSSFSIILVHSKNLYLLYYIN